MIETAELFAGVLPFAKVAETSSFSQAAEELGVSTAAISKAVSRLEERLGVRLLTRTSRSVALTPEGVQFWARCREAISSMEAGRELMSQSRRQPSGPLSVSMSFILGSRVVPELARFTARHPKITLRVTLSDRISRLGQENIDVALRVGARQDSSLVERRLLAPRWVTVASPGLLAQSGLPKSPADLERFNCLRFILPSGRPRDFSFRDPGSGASETLAVNGNLQIDHGDRLLDAALSGMGVAQVLDFMVVEHVRAGRLVELLAEFSPPGPPVCAVSAPERSKTPNVRAFVAFLTELFAGRAA